MIREDAGEFIHAAWNAEVVRPKGLIAGFSLTGGCTVRYAHGNGPDNGSKLDAEKFSIIVRGKPDEEP